MAWRRAIVIAAVGLLVSGFFAEILADRPPIGWWGGPGPKPWAWGDPDWPAYSRDTGVRGRRATMDDAGGLSREPGGFAVESIRSESYQRIQGRQELPLRQFNVKAMGVTIAIRRK